MSRPSCTVKGSPVRGGVCSRVMVGMRECGDPAGSCQYQGPPAEAAWRPVRPGPAFTLDHVKPSPARQCIACGAQVLAGRSEACPHD